MTGAPVRSASPRSFALSRSAASPAPPAQRLAQIGILDQHDGQQPETLQFAVQQAFLLARDPAGIGVKRGQRLAMRIEPQKQRHARHQDHHPQ